MHEFLSEDWIAATRGIRERYADQTPEVPVAVRVNLTVSDVPFDDAELHAYIDTSDGAFDLELGALDEPDVSLATEWALVRGLLVDGRPELLMQAFLEGHVRIQGDMARLLALQGAVVQQADNPVAAQVAAELRAITKD